MTPDPLEVTEGAMVKYTCKVHGKPLPELRWMRGSEMITDDERRKIQMTENASKHEIDSSFIIEKSRLEDESQTYHVQAENKAGNISHDFSLTGIIISALVGKVNCLVCTKLGVSTSCSPYPAVLS